VLAAAAIASGIANAQDGRRAAGDTRPPARPETYTGRDGAYTMPFPDLGPRTAVRDTMVNPQTAWAEFAGGEGATLYVVSMRLAHGPRDARELDAVQRRYADFAGRLPEHFSSRTGKGRFGPTYGFVLLNAEAITGYPLKLGYRAAPGVDSAAAHRFFVSGGTLYEIAALVQRRGGDATLPSAALAARAAALVDDTLKTFEPLEVKPPQPEKR
jgi:hypothetical protein